jgi:hypothetical protein
MNGWPYNASYPSSTANIQDVVVLLRDFKGADLRLLFHVDAGLDNDLLHAAIDNFCSALQDLTWCAVCSYTITQRFGFNPGPGTGAGALDVKANGADKAEMYMAYPLNPRLVRVQIPAAARWRWADQLPDSAYLADGETVDPAYGNLLATAMGNAGLVPPGWAVPMTSEYFTYVRGWLNRKLPRRPSPGWGGETGGL